MSRFIITTSLTAFLLGCSPAPDAEQPSHETAEVTEDTNNTDTNLEITGEPITIHARFNYTDKMTSASIGADKSLVAKLLIESDLRRTGSGATAQYHEDQYVDRVKGSVSATGSLNLVSEEVSSQETYQMQGDWQLMAVPTAGRFSIKPPSQSDIGDGPRIEFEIKAPVSGIKKAVIKSANQQMDSEVTHSRSFACSNGEAGGDICDISFTIEPVPTEAKNGISVEFLENAKQVYNLQGKKAADGGLLMYSNSLPVYGSTTSYHNGHFVTRLKASYTESLDGGVINQVLDVVVWSTERGSNWQPD